ncbi:MAG TPA: ATP-dependent helicase [Solirubrobacteraceae bacterium]
MFVEAAAPSYLEALNEQQRAAATHPGGPLLVLAGAGTGKTTTLAARVAWLIGEGAAPERVLLLTFTRRAAREMLARARSYLGRSPHGRHAGRVVGGTFHSVAHRFVRRHAAALGLPGGFGVLDAGDAADLLDLVRQDAGVGQTGRRFPRKSTLLDIYSRTVNAQRPLREVLAGAFPWCERHGDELARLFVEYGARKRSLGVLDLDDLLLYWRALAQDGVVGGEIAGAVEHLLVDEYQDVNGLQVDLVRALRADRPEVTVVGDDLQAIYGFRSASPSHILDFPQHFPGATTVALERNYRATQPLLDVANAVAEQAARTYRKVLRAARTGGRAPELVACLDESAQATEVCERVLDARERGALLREQAVLMRASHDSDLLELELARRDIPFVKYGGLRYLEAAHVKDFLALLRLADNASDRLSWFRWLQLLDGVGPATARRVLEAIEPDAGGLADVLARWPLARGALPTEAREPGDAVIAALAAAAPDTAAAGDAAHRTTAAGAAAPHTITAGRRAELLRDALGPIVEAHYPDGAVRLQDLDALVAAAAQASDLGRFVAELVLDPPASSSDLAGPGSVDEDWLVLSTVHSAKGLEWRSVHVLSLYDGNFPSDLAAGDREAIEEERRLLYVALTRAQRDLHLYVPMRYYHRPRGLDDGHGYGKVSRFLTDGVQALCRRTDCTGLAAEPGAAAGADALADGAAGSSPRRRIEVSVDALFG